MLRKLNTFRPHVQSITCRLSPASFSTAKASMSAERPMYNRMMQKFQTEFLPTHLEVLDESTLHAEHEAMRGYGFNETHFRILIVSEKFNGKLPVARHRMVYALLDEEFKNNGLHAINIVAKTPSEYSTSQL